MNVHVRETVFSCVPSAPAEWNKVLMMSAKCEELATEMYDADKLQGYLNGERHSLYVLSCCQPVTIQPLCLQSQPKESPH